MTVMLDELFRPEAERESSCIAKDQVDIGSIHGYGDLNSLWLNNNIITPNNDGDNDFAAVRGFGICTGCSNAYNATKFEFVIYNRYGGIVYTQEGVVNDLQNGFIQDFIRWNGENDDGNVVQNDVYEATLKIGNCENPISVDNPTVSVEDTNSPYNPNGVYLFKWFIAVVQ